MSTPVLSDNERQELLKKANYNARVLFWVGVSALAVPLVLFLYIQIAGIVLNPSSTYATYGWILWVFNVPLMVSIFLLNRWYKKKQAETYSAVYNGILMQGTVVECPLVEHDYGVSQQVLLQWEWEGTLVKGSFEFLTQEPLLNPGQAVDFQWEPELKRLFVVAMEGLPVALGEVRRGS